jgi:hypothetical protein
MESEEFYDLLFAPVVAELGPFDTTTMTAIVGFDVGGPISLMTIGRDRRNEFVTYVTCELATREDQVPSDYGRYELLLTCDDESWAWDILTNVGQMTTDEAFDHGHTLDIAPWVGEEAILQGLAFERQSSSRIENCVYSVLRVHGLTRAELEQAISSGLQHVMAQREKDGVYPRTRVHCG